MGSKTALVDTNKYTKDERIRQISLDTFRRRPDGDPNDYDEQVVVAELVRVSQYSPLNLIYFIVNYCLIYSNDEHKWIPFELWDTDCDPYDNQLDLVQKIFWNQHVASIKSRQIGATWIVLCVFLWLMLFFPRRAILLLSKGEEEAKELMWRLKGIYDHLPEWMKVEKFEKDSKLEWELSNGSRAKSVSTRGGDSMTFTDALIDEADLIYRSATSLSQVLLNVSPTVGMKGRLVMISKSDKKRPNSTFKAIVRDAMKGASKYVFSFIPWYVNPERTADWYESERRASLAIDDTEDHLWESYPSNPLEALAPQSSDKRLPFNWLRNCFNEESQPLYRIIKDETEYDGYEGPQIDGLVIWKIPELNGSYVVLIDPAEGTPTSNDTAIMVMDVITKEEVATYAGKLDPISSGMRADQLAQYYNRAPIMFEANNHGALLGNWLQENASVTLLRGWSPSSSTRSSKAKLGWKTNMPSKIIMFDQTAKSLHLQDCIINDQRTYHQLSSIEKTTLKAPQGDPDDLAIVFALGVATIELALVTFSLDFIKLNG
jgi:hypothetical protein